MLEKKLLGHCGVDSGQLMITDPCYIESSWRNNAEYDDEKIAKMKKKKKYDFTYNGACASTMSDESGGQLHNELGIDIAVAFSSGYGDGVYPVYGYYNSEGRIMKVVVDMR